ncbi:MAG: sensor histidine kinase [Solirubrobacteraceae bacterium]
MSRLPHRRIAFRLVAAACLASLAAVVVLCALSIVLVRRELRDSLDSALRGRAVAVAQLAVSAPALLTSAGALESPASGRQIAVEVLDAHGRILARSLTLGASLLPLDTLARAAIARGATGYEDVTVAGEPYRLYAAPIAQAGGPAAGGAVLVASDTSDISSTLAHLRLVLAIAGLAVALAATAAAVGLTSRALRPLRRLVGSAGEIELTADTSRRLPDPGTADELAQLTGVLNRMLASLQRAQATERRFLADAAHELRTPITALIGNAEYLARHGADADALADLRHDADRIARLVEDLLTLERQGVPGSGMAPVELDELVRGVAGELGHGGSDGHDGLDGRIAFGPLAPARVRGDRVALARALRNLIENAFVHGPEDGAVTVSVTREGPDALLTVADEGPGPDADEAERVFERFWRGRDAAGRAGSGLGLAIVAAIAARHGGRVSVDGSAFTLRLPVD